MRSLFTKFLLLLAFTIPAAAVNAQSPQRVKIRMNVEVSTKSGLRVKFAEVVNDSRCPAGVNCVWAGNAQIKIRVRAKNTKPETFILNTALEPKAITYKGYDFKIVDLGSLSKNDENRSNYRVTLEITRKRT